MDLYDQNQLNKGSQSGWRSNGNETSLKGIEKITQEILPNVVVGDRFHPNDEELVDYYLKRFILDLGYEGNYLPIAEVNVYKFEPWELPGYSKIESNDQEWYFISPIVYMNKKKKRCSRKTKAGTWKPTGNARKVLKRGSKKVIGSKRTLVFHKKGLKTEWVMHEYQLNPDSDISNAGEFVIIKLKRKFDELIEKSKHKNNSSMNCDYKAVDSTCTNDAIVSSHCKSQSHADNEMSVDSPSSSDIQSSVTELELQEYGSNSPSASFLLEDESSLGKDNSKSPLSLEDHSASPKSPSGTSDVQLSINELKDSFSTIPKIFLVLDDQSFVNTTDDGREYDNLEEEMNEAVFSTSKILQTEEFATLSEILDFF